MAKIGHVRGMLLEEALLHLLRGSGYRTVESDNGDPTLHVGHSGMEVHGRGGTHQIDAIADFLIQAPFAHPQRLLVEAKCYTNRPVEIGIARNAVGVLKDVSEFWVSRSGVPRQRYHYTYALFSASGYTDDAERYSFAQDVYLIPLANSPFMKPILRALFSIATQDFPAIDDRGSIQVDLKELRRSIRQSLRDGTFRREDMRQILGQAVVGKLGRFVDECTRVNYALLAVLTGGLPIFLVPSDGLDVGTLPAQMRVRIFWDERGWYLRPTNGQPLFSFDLPLKLFELYAEEGSLTALRALDLKEEFMSEMRAIIYRNDELRVITFFLDRDWIETVRARIRR